MNSASRPVIFLSGGYPPGIDGIGDHTRRLAIEMSHFRPVQVWTGPLKGRAPEDGFPVTTVFDPARPTSIKRLAERLKGGGDAEVFVQYNPFGFGPRGINPHLAGALRDLRARPGVRITVMFHETHVPPENLKFLLMLAGQYPQFAAVARLADAIFVSTGRWDHQVRRVRRDIRIRLLPVGSNVDASTLPHDAARRQWKLAPEIPVLAVFGSAHASRLIRWIASAANAVAAQHPGAALLYVGEDGKALKPLLSADMCWRDLGALPASEVGHALRAADLMLAPFVDGLSTRRGSVMAAMQQGLPVHSTLSPWTDSVLQHRDALGIFLSPMEEGETGFVSRTCELLRKAKAGGEPLADFYRNHFDWPTLAAVVEESLQAPAV